MESWRPGDISAITLFVSDVERAKSFYQEAFGLSVHFEDDESAVFRFGGTLLNLLLETEAPELIEPAIVAPAEAGARMQLTIPVEDVDAVCEELTRRGIGLLNGPMDRPWGPRTAAFRDPDGHVWEISRH